MKSTRRFSMLTPDEVKPLVEFDWGVSNSFEWLESDHFWREHPLNNGMGLLILGQQVATRVTEPTKAMVVSLRSFTKTLPL